MDPSHCGHALLPTFHGAIRATNVVSVYKKMKDKPIAVFRTILSLLLFSLLVFGTFVMLLNDWVCSPRSVEFLIGVASTDEAGVESVEDSFRFLPYLLPQSFSHPVRLILGKGNVVSEKRTYSIQKSNLI